MVTSNSSSLIDCFVHQVGDRFYLNGLGSLNYFLGVEVFHTMKRLFLSQRKYIHDLLLRSNKLEFRYVVTHLFDYCSLSLIYGTNFPDAIEYK